MDKAAAREIVAAGHRQGRRTLSEYESKRVLAAYGIPVCRERLVDGRRDLERAAAEIGFPLVLKGSAAQVTHKSERDLIRVDLRTIEEAGRAFDDIMERIEGPEAGVLVQEMVAGRRELVVGMTRDRQFGPCVMFGLGGILTEILDDIAFRRAPLERSDALDLLGAIRGRRILEAVRGMPAADTEALADILVRVGRIGLDIEEVAEIDVNPVILAGARPVAVDALVVLG